MTSKLLPRWKDDHNKIIICEEKIKVMQENFLELQQIAQDMFEDAILMDINPNQVKEAMHDVIINLINPYSH